MTPAQVDGPLTALKTSGIEFEPEFLIRAFRLMYASRRIDDREILLKRQDRIFFQVSAAGHEAAQVAAGLALRPGHDWCYPYYRDRALALALGVSPYEMMLQAVGAAIDPASGGRQMPSHWSDPARRIVSSSSPTGTQYLQAVGCAEAVRYQSPTSDAVVLVSSGEGATSEGEFWEAVNAACLRKLPVVFFIQDNGYAISVPKQHQTPGGNISQLLSGFPNLHRVEVDGTDFLASYAAASEAVAYARAGKGPAFVHAHLVRLYSHSLSDVEKDYKSAQEREAETALDPISTFPQRLLDEGLLDRHGLLRMTHEVDAEIQEATQLALPQEPPVPPRLSTISIPPRSTRPVTTSKPKNSSAASPEPCSTC